MRVLQAFACTLGLASTGFVLFAFFNQAIDFRSLALVALGAVALIATLLLSWCLGLRGRWLLIGLSGLYSASIAVALALQIDQERLMVIRAGLSLLLISGLLLMMWCAYGIKPPSRRRSWHNYYD